MSFRTVSTLERIQWISLSAAGAIIAGMVITIIIMALMTCVIIGVDLIAW